MSNTETKTAHKRKVLVDCRVEADMGLRFYYRETQEEYAKRLERECRDFIEHCRDHRSLNHIALEVVRDYEDRCSVCGNTWEPIDENGEEVCSACLSKVAQGEEGAG